jgi:hypothetical protein
MNSALREIYREIARQGYLEKRMHAAATAAQRNART